MNHPSPTLGRLTRRLRWPMLLGIVPVALVGTASYMTAPLEEPTRTSRAVASRGAAPADPSAVSTSPEPGAEDAPGAARPSWPEGRLEGVPAKEILLAAMRDAQQRLEGEGGYTATFTKQERIRGRLGPEQTMRLKLRHEPFAVYLKFLAPKKGKEAVYAEGHRDNKVIGHNGDWTRRLIPRLSVDPTDPLALVDNRHPITEAGLLNLTRKLVGFRELDLRDEEAVTILDRTTGEDGRAWLRSLHTHPSQNPERPFARVEILYHPDTFIPFRITSYDWPKPGHEGDLELAETYTYDDVDFEAVLTDLDFDPSNPDYAFTRF